jgi:hypothetical protein
MGAQTASPQQHDQHTHAHPHPHPTARSNHATRQHLGTVSP